MKTRIMLPLLVIALCAVATVGWLRRESEDAMTLIRNEEAAVTRVKALFAAQKIYHETHGIYGWASELVRDGLVEGGSVGAEGQIPVGTSYRIDILLPFQSMSKGAVQIIPFGQEPANDALRAKHLAIVARPIRPVLDGYRTYYLNQDAVMFVREGVREDHTREHNDLPPMAVIESNLEDVSGVNWIKIVEAKKP